MLSHALLLSSNICSHEGSRPWRQRHQGYGCWQSGTGHATSKIACESCLFPHRETWLGPIALLGTEGWCVPKNHDFLYLAWAFLMHRTALLWAVLIDSHPKCWVGLVEGGRRQAFSWGIYSKHKEWWSFTSRLMGCITISPRIAWKVMIQLLAKVLHMLPQHGL